MQNKKGVIRIIEAIIAVLILLGVVITMMARQPTKVDFAGSIYTVEHQILSEIADNNKLRTAVIFNDSVPIECFIQSRLQTFSLDFNISFSNVTEYVQCGAPLDKEVYTAEQVISTDIIQRDFTPKKLVMCAWLGKLTERNCAAVCVPSTEVCTGGADEDCDGLIDSADPDCAIITCDGQPVGATKACWTESAYVGGSLRNMGICHDGIQTCQNIGGIGTWSSCAGEITPQFEICGDALDNNCNGQLGENCAPTVCLSPAGLITFASGYPTGFNNRVRFKVSTSLTSGTFFLRVYYSTDLFKDGQVYDLAVYPSGTTITDATLDWPSASVITIVYNGICQDRKQL